MLKIIAGKHKNRIIPTLKNAKYRPSTAKLREAIFSILTSGEFIENPILPNSNVLDLFSGTGSLAFEALSRGARSVTLIDNTNEYLKSAKLFADNIGEGDNAIFLCMNAFNLPKALYTYNLVFIDPPYHKGLVEKAISSLVRGQWLENQAVLIVESAKTDDFLNPENIELVKERVYGNNKLSVLKYNV